MRLTKEQKQRAHLCGIPGCENPWVSSFYGRRCALHNGSMPTKQIPSTPPVKSWTEPEGEDDAEG